MSLYCDCDEARKEHVSKGKGGRREFYAVPTCSEGICAYCGFYAISSPRQYKPQLERYENFNYFPDIFRIEEPDYDNEK